ncbi:YopX family protein [Lysinibacillus boronitolerans]|uniref:YopX family protein n=1 Tax=Lysinibacillus boronitolerans TaxID=309788 RepID=UPI00216351A1|nr:YopX family protein [Lysinibacillus boronitolerans]MCS1394142.1 YopX family protein [Lysinibacillus boronitolerans]
MRKPKFRGFSKETSSWHYGHGWFEIDYTEEYLLEKGIEKQAMLYTEGYPIECELKSMGEYTGLKDKHGTEIFEGDILAINNTRYVVGYREYSGGWQLEIKNEYCAEMVQGNCELLEIIGNIYENPELLEATA